MYIKSLTIKNFRCFGKGADGNGTKINLNKGITSIIGKNGSGKTAILEALNFLIGSEYLSSSKISEKDFHKDARTNEIEDAILIEGETEKPFFIDVDVISEETKIGASVIVPCDKIRLKISRRKKAEKILDEPFIIQKTVVPIFGEIDGLIYSDENLLGSSYKIENLEEVLSPIDNLEKAREIIKNIIKGETTEINQVDNFYQIKYKLKNKSDLRSAFFPDYILSFNQSRIKGLAKAYYLSKNRDEDVSGSYALISKILTDLHWRYKREQIKSQTNEIFSQYEILAGLLRDMVDKKGDLILDINNAIQEICCENKNFQIDFLDIDQPYKSAFIAKKDSDKLLFPSNLGSGFNILTAYALFSYIAKKEKVPIVLIIDEPEIHLHSDWQKKMYDVFTKQVDIQFIYSTQSERFISLKKWEQIRLIRDGQIFPKRGVLEEKVKANDGQVATVAEFLNDFSKKNLNLSTFLVENLELFFTNKCIVVEGVSEKYALPKFLMLSGCDFNNYSVSIIPAWGKTKINKYQMICKAFDLDYFTIFDNDMTVDSMTEVDNKVENESISTGAKHGNLLGFSSSFEKLLGIGGEKKFQKLTKFVDDLKDINLLENEIKNGVQKLKEFIES